MYIVRVKTAPPPNVDATSTTVASVRQQMMQHHKIIASQQRVYADQAVHVMQAQAHAHHQAHMRAQAQQARTDNHKPVQMKATAPFAITAGNVGGGDVSSRAVEGGSVPGAVPPPPSAQPEMAAMLAGQKGSKSSTGSRTSSNITNTAPTPNATAPTPTATATASINGSGSSSNGKGNGVGGVGCIPTGGSPRSNNLQVDSSSANADHTVGGVPIVLLSRDLSVRGGDNSSHGIANGIADMRSIIGGGGSSSGGGGGAPKRANVIVASRANTIARPRGKRECPSCKAVVGKYRRTSYHLYESYGRTVQCTHVQCGAPRQHCSFAGIGACRTQNLCLPLILSSGLVYFLF